MEKFNYYFNTQEKIDNVLSGPINKSTIESVIFHLVWYVYYNISKDELTIANYIDDWMVGKTNLFHMSAYAKFIKSVIKKMSKMPWRNIQDTIKIRKSELEYINSFNDIKKEKLLFCYLAIAKFMDASRERHTHWENENDTTVFKMARITIPSDKRDNYIYKLINEEPKALIYLNYKNDDVSKRIDYISEDENDPIVLELDESNYYELAYTYLNWKNGGGYKQCKCCGKLFKVKTNIMEKGRRGEINKSNRTQYCRNCSPVFEPKYKDKDVMSLDYEPKKTICVDCGTEFYLENYKDTATCRCPDCNETYKKQLKSEQNRRYYQSNQ